MFPLSYILNWDQPCSWERVIPTKELKKKKNAIVAASAVSYQHR